MSARPILAAALAAALAFPLPAAAQQPIVVKFSHVKGAARDTEGARSPGWW